MSAKQTLSEKGFTIIETLLVLAIAGLILVIVFMAIPTLERNSRNSQRKQDIQIILEAVSHWELNHSGDLPFCGQSGAISNCTAALGENPLQLPVKLTFYSPTTCPGAGNCNVFIHPFNNAVDSAAAGTLTNADVNTVQVYNYQKCDSANPGTSTAAAAGYTDVVALYGAENSNGGGTALCQQL